MARLRCEACETVIASAIPDSLDRHVASSICWRCRPVDPAAAVAS